MLVSCVTSSMRYIAMKSNNLYISRGTWKTANFKKYNFEAMGIPTNGGALHPLLKVREEFRNIFLEMGYGFAAPFHDQYFINLPYLASRRCPQHHMLNLHFGASILCLCLSNIQLEIYRIHSIFLVNNSL